MAKSRLEDRTLIPIFHLPARDKKIFDSSDFKRKRNLVIFFLSCGEQEFLIRIEDAYDRIKEQNGEAVVICPAPLEEIEGMYRKNRLSYWILSDEKQEIFSRFIESSKGEGVAALFVTDKFGEIFFQYIVETIKELPPFEDIVKSLEFIESQCPECEGGL